MTHTGQGPPKTSAERRSERAQVDDVAIVMEAALRFLEPRARSTAEVRRRLTKAGYRAELVETVVNRLTDLRMLDDEAFAREWVRSRDRTHPRGERALRSELRAKGLPDDVITAVLAGRDSPAGGDVGATPDEEAARRLIERKASFLRRAGEPRQVRQRAYVLLVRNGFSSELAWRLAGTVGRDDPDAAAVSADS